MNISIHNNLNTVLTITNMATMCNCNFISDKFIENRIGHNKLITNKQENNNYYYLINRFKLNQKSIYKKSRGSEKLEISRYV